MTFGLPIPDPIGPLNRVNDTRNLDAQAHDHDAFADTIDQHTEWIAAADADPALTALRSRWAGITRPPFALQWFRGAPGIIDVCYCGDSTVEGNVGIIGQILKNSVYQGGAGNWAERLSTALGIPIIGAGFQPIWRQYLNTAGALPYGGWVDGRIVYDATASAGSKTVATPTGAFTAADVGSTFKLYDALGNLILNSTIQFVDSATQVRTVATASGNTAANGRAYIGSDNAWPTGAPTDAWNCAPFQLGQHASGTAATQKTFELPPGMTCAAYKLYWLDAAGAGNWRHRRDAGAWVPMAQTRAADNDLHSFTIVGGATKSISVQAWTGTAAAPCYLAGLGIYAVNPATVTRGLVGHNVAKDGWTLSSFVGAGGPVAGGTTPAATNSKPLAILSGSPGSLNPELITSLFTNDATFDTAAARLALWNTNLGKLLDAAAAVTGHAADVLLMNAFEQANPPSDPTVQATYRAALKSVAATRARAVLDIYDALALNGVTGYAAANSAGLMTDALHQSAAGHEFIADRMLAALAG